MDRNSILIGGALLVVGLFVGYSFGSQRTPTGEGPMMSDGSTMSQNIDQHFIVQMIPHHDGAIAMAKIALERSKRPEVISLANAIIEAQERENAAMRSWYQAWFGSAPPEDGMGMTHMGSMTDDTAALTNISAAEFDREFVEQMIPHHEMAIMMAQMLRASTERAEMKELANNIITSQSQEIQMMRDWLLVW